jgi:hypothetical protein
MTPSQLLFILFINALLRLFDHSELHHGVSGAPGFNHLAFSVDLSLYLNSEVNANKLLTKVHLFEKRSRLRIALTKSFVTAVMHGKGTELRTSGATRCLRAQSHSTSNAHPWDLIAMEEKDDEYLTLRRLRSNITDRHRCFKCQKQKLPYRIPQDPPLSKDSAPICISCRSQWLPSGILYNGNPLPVIPGSSPHAFSESTGTWRVTAHNRSR